MKFVEKVTSKELYLAAAPLIAEAIVRSCRRQRFCRFGIVGGRSTPSVIEHLLPYVVSGHLQGHVEVYWLDERVAPEKNYISVLPMLERLRLAGLDITWYPFMSMHREQMDVEAHQVLDQLSSITGIPALDVILVSAGEDGHIASLFPHRDEIHDQDCVFRIVEHTPKPPHTRVTATPALVRTAKQAFILFVGDKHNAYRMFTDDHIGAGDCPAKLVLSIPDLTVLVSIDRK